MKVLVQSTNIYKMSTNPSPALIQISSKSINVYKIHLLLFFYFFIFSKKRFSRTWILMRFRQNRNDRRSSVLTFSFSLEAHSQYSIKIHLLVLPFTLTNAHEYWYTYVGWNHAVCCSSIKCQLKKCNLWTVISSENTSNLR